MFSVFTYIMSRVTHSEPGLPMAKLHECHLKYTENELKFQNTKEQMIIKSNPTIPEQFVNVFIEQKHENKNKILVQFSVQKCR